LAGSVTENVTKLGLASVRMQVVERSQLRKLPSSNNIDRQQSVAMSITVTMSATQSHMPDVDAAEMSNSRRSPSMISISVGDDHPCSGRTHGFLRSFSLTGTIFLSIPSHFARIQSSRSQLERGLSNDPPP